MMKKVDEMKEQRVQFGAMAQKWDERVKKIMLENEILTSQHQSAMLDRDYISTDHKLVKVIMVEKNATIKELQD